MRRLFFLLLLVTFPVSAAPRRRGVIVPPVFPSCSVVTGTPAVTFTRDDGRTLAPLADRLESIAYTYGLAALDTPGSLLSWHNLTLSLSVDDGCSWRPVATASSVEFPPSIAAAPGGRAYVWSDNRQFIARFDSRGLQSLKAPGAIIGIGVDETNGDHLRVGTAGDVNGVNGVIWDSGDGGATWNPVGQLPSAPSMLYRFAFDPHDLDHIVSGAASVGASVTHDGGRNWTRTNIADGMNAFNIVISPVDGNVVWLMGLELARTEESPAFGRHIYRSTDGGLTFHAVVDQSSAVTLINGPLLAADPRDSAVLYFVFGTYFQGYGTDLFRFDAASNRLTVAHNDYHDIDAIAFSRTDPRVMYLGLENENIH